MKSTWPYHNWGEMLEEFKDPITHCTLDDATLHKEFRGDGPEFTAWSKEWVYFPACYDGCIWVAKVPRNPCDHSTEHVGG